MASEIGDRTCKIFVGGLAWETQTETLKNYFEQFGDIHEAVVITDRATGKSKGYGFVTYKDPKSARRACENPYPVIDGRRANCNLAYLGAHKRSPPLLQHGMEKTKTAVTCMVPSTVDFGQPQVPRYAFSSTYGYPTFSHNFIQSMNYYNAYYSGQEYFRFPGAGEYINYYSFPLALYTQAQRQQHYPNQHPKMVYLPYFSPHFPSLPITAGSATDEAAAGHQECGHREGLPLEDA